MKNNKYTTDPAKAASAKTNLPTGWERCRTGIKGSRKWRNMATKCWVTKTGAGCHVGYRGEYLGFEKKTVAQCIAEISAMFDHFHGSSPNTKASEPGT